MQNRKLLLATDFSPASERAREAALQLARAFEAEVTVLHVVESPRYPYPVAVPSSTRQAATTDLDRVARAMQGAGVRTVPMLREGNPYAEIVTAAKDANVDLLIIGTHGHRGLDHLLLGSVAEKVVRVAPGAVLTVPPWRHHDRTAAGIALSHELQKLRHERPIVLALSRGALPIAREIAKGFETSLDVLVVRQMESDGKAVGAVAEDGTTLVDDQVVSQLAISREALGGSIESARQLCRDESISLRGARWIIDVGDRTVVIVSDGITSPWPTAVAASLLRGMKARRLVAATPAISTRAIEATARHVDEFVSIEQVEEPRLVALLYRDPREPSDAEALELLSAAVTSHQSAT
jgi:putative phosphoribosyl transferase